MYKLTYLLPAIVWALAMIAAAFVFKGTSAALPIVSGMTGLAVVFVVLRPRKSCL